MCTIQLCFDKFKDEFLQLKDFYIKDSQTNEKINGEHKVFSYSYVFKKLL